MTLPSNPWRKRAIGAAYAALGFALAGCIIEERSGPPPPSIYEGPTTCTTAIGPAATVSILPDRALTATPGDGAGIFVEYATGGHWHVWTTCDTTHTGYPCSFDLFVRSMGGAVGNLAGESLEGGDSLVQSTPVDVELRATVSSETDGMYFDVPAGAAIRLESYLDCAATPRLVYWFGSSGDGEAYVHSGAPSDPVDFVPTAP